MSWKGSNNRLQEGPDVVDEKEPDATMSQIVIQKKPCKII